MPLGSDGWTVNDLDDLPDDGLGYELVDGSLRVSPPPTVLHSVTEDRLVKSAQYAAAGVVHFWRLELSAAPVLLTHELEGRVYRETGRFLDEVLLDRPVPLRFRLGELLR